MTLAELIIELAIRFPKLEKGLEEAALKVEQTLGGMKASADKLSGLDQALAPLTSGLLKAGAAGTAIVAGLLFLAKGAADSAEQFEKLKLAAIASTEAIDLAKLEESANSIARLGKGTKGAAIEFQRLLVSSGRTQEQIDSLTPRVLDLAKVTGADLPTAARLLTRAMEGQNSALMRYGIFLNKAIDPTRDFAGWLKEVDRATGRAAQGAMSLSEAFLSLTNGLGALRSALGAPLVGDLTNVVSLLAKGAWLARDFAKAFEGPIGIILKVVGVLGVFLAVLGTLAVAILAIKGTLGVIVAALGSVGIAVPLVVLGKFVLILGAVLAVVLLTVKAYEKWRDVLDEVSARMGRITPRRQAKIDAGKDAAQRAALEKEQQAEVKRLEEIAELHDERARKNAIASAQRQAGIMAVARVELQAAGQTEEGLAGIQERITAQMAEENRQRVRDSLAANEITLADLRKSLESRKTDRKAAEKEIDALVVAQHNLQKELDASYTEEYVRQRQARFDAEKQLQTALVRLLSESNQTRIALLRQQAEGQVTLDRQTLDLIQQRSQIELETIRRTEDMRISMLRRVIDAENQARRQALDLQEIQANLQAKREEIALNRLQRARAEAVKQGYLSEAEAREIAEAEAEALEERRLQREIEMEEKRLAVTLAGIAREMEFLKQEAASKVLLLLAELKHKKAAMEQSVKWREYELKMSNALAKNESEFRARELEARGKLELNMLRVSLRARAIGGQMSADELNARLKEIDALEKGFDIQLKGLAEVSKAREALAAQQITGMKVADQEAIVAAERDTSDKIKAIAEETVAALKRLEGDRVAEVTKSGATIESILMSIADKAKISDAEIAAAGRSGLAALANSWRELGGTIQGVIGSAVTQWKTWWDSIKGTVGTVKDLKEALDALKDEELPEGPEGKEGVWVPPPKPFRIGPLGPQTPPAPSAIAPAPGAAPVQQTINVSGTQVKLDADKQRLFQDLLKMLMGPEGAKEFEEFMRRQAGPHAAKT